MTDEQIRIAIAEACPSIVRKGDYSEDFELFLISTGQKFDPLNDLNAMHEAEKALFSTHEAVGCTVYRDWLLKLTADAAGQNVFYTLRATARQRAEAFLRTLNLWKED